MATKSREKEKNVCFFSHSPFFPSEQGIFIELSIAQFLALLLHEIEELFITLKLI
jgi:hypothetical protein